MAVTTLWANEQRYYPLEVVPYTPVARLEQGKDDPAFHTKPQIALEMIASAQAAGIAFKAVVADPFRGDCIQRCHAMAPITRIGVEVPC